MNPRPDNTHKSDAFDDIGPAFDRLPAPTWAAFISWLEYVTLHGPGQDEERGNMSGKNLPVDGSSSHPETSDGKTFDSERAEWNLTLPNRDAARLRWFVQVLELLESKTESQLTEVDGKLLTELIRKYKDG